VNKKTLVVAIVATLSVGAAAVGYVMKSHPAVDTHVGGIATPGPYAPSGSVNFSTAAFRYFYILGDGLTGYKVTDTGDVKNVPIAKAGDLGCRTDSGIATKSGKWMYLGCTPIWMGREGSPTIMPCKLDDKGWVKPQPSHKQPTGKSPFGMLMSDDDRFLYVSTNDGISQFRIGTDGLPVPLNPPMVPGGVIGSLNTLSSNGKYAYATYFRQRRLYQMKVNSNGTLTPLSPPFVETGPGPMEAHVDPHGRYVWCVDSLGQSVDRFQVKPDGTLKRLGPATGGLGRQPTSLQVSRDGRYAYVARYRYNSIMQFAIQEDGTFDLNDPVSAPGAGGPATFRLDPSGRFAFGLNFQYNMLSLYSINSKGTLDPANPSSLLMGEHSHDIIFAPRK
jgi:hypothetical protein